MRLGITYTGNAGPSLTSKLIFGAATPLAFAGGFCEITRSCGTSCKLRCATEPSVSPRLRIFKSAMRSLPPVTSGIATRCGPRLCATRIDQPRRTFAPGDGICVMIFPSGIVALKNCRSTTTCRPDAAPARSASLGLMPISFGIATSWPWIASCIAVSAEISDTVSRTSARSNMRKNCRIAADYNFAVITLCKESIAVLILGSDFGSNFRSHLTSSWSCP